MNREIRDCEDALEVLAAYLDGELAGGTGEQVRKHLSTCRSCYSRAEFEKRLKAKIADSGRRGVPTELEHRVEAVIEQFEVESTGEASG